MKKENLKDIYPLSPLQEGMLYHALFGDDASAYVEQFSYRVTTPFEPDLFAQSWQELVDRHDILRTTFEYEKTRQPCQIVLKKVHVDVPQIDLSNLDDEQRQAALEELRRQEREKPFDPSAGQLARLSIIRLDDTHFELLRTHHHILLDGWSSGILLKDLMEIYSAKRKGIASIRPAPTSSAPYYHWVKEQDMEEGKAYWRSLVQDRSPTHLPFLSQPASSQTFDAQKHILCLSKQMTAALESLCAQLGVTGASLCRAVWGILLSRYTQRNDIMFPSIVSTRPVDVAQSAEMVGLFINTVPIVLTLDEQEAFADFVQRTQRSFLEGSTHHHVPLSDIWSFDQQADHLFAFENFHIAEGFENEMTQGTYGLTIENVTRFEHTHYDFTVAISPDECWCVDFSFNAAKISAEQVERIADHFMKVMESITTNPNIQIGDIDIVPASEHKQLNAFNPSSVPLPETSIIQMFDEQVRNRPQACAIQFQGQSTTFKELERQVSALAQKLQQDFKVTTGSHVGVLLPRSDKLIYTLLACLKAGAVYIPIDPDYPDDRIEFILRDSEAVCVITDHAGAKRLQSTRPLLNLETASFDSNAPVISPTTQSGIAYMCYTSGSTGQPKGVMVTQAGLLNLVCWHQQQFDLKEGGRATLFASPAFDASVWEIVPNIVSGLTLYPLDANLRPDSDALIDFLATHHITHAFLPPAICEDISVQHAGRLSTNLKILTGGDVLKNVHITGPQIFNNYGPTECSVVASSTQIEEGKPITIGRPVTNIEVYILDNHQRPCPIGIDGEIHLGGIGLARGYWKRDDLTAEKFIPHPTNPNTRLYKTGDIAHWDDQGNLHFKGRNDDQVQLRGYRVEPGEIERRLQDHLLIQKAVVVTQENSKEEMEILAFCQCDTQGEDLENKIKNDLIATLPTYMIPRRIMVVDTFPLTLRGKIDRDALINLLPAIEQKRTLKAPTTPTEKAVFEIWCEVLERDDIGIDESFFALGGHSLTATRVMSRLRNRLDCDLSFKTLFDHPTIAALAGQIEQARNENNTQSQPILRSKRRQNACAGE